MLSARSLSCLRGIEHMGMRSKHRTMTPKKKACSSLIEYKSERASRRNSSISVSSISLPEQLERNRWRQEQIQMGRFRRICSHEGTRFCGAGVYSIRSSDVGINSTSKFQIDHGTSKLVPAALVIGHTARNKSFLELVNKVIYDIIAPLRQNWASLTHCHYPQTAIILGVAVTDRVVAVGNILVIGRKIRPHNSVEAWNHIRKLVETIRTDRGCGDNGVGTVADDKSDEDRGEQSLRDRSREYGIGTSVSYSIL